ncbi:hypothetical protein [Hymenobacter sp. B81]|uniref:hypothetical protein n=1 Tax=Hymenobacter sp. B81 TaxID=3344878 RepID=UPI0037DC672C
MGKQAMLRSYMVKRTPNGRVRFSLHQMAQSQVVELLKEVATEPAPDGLDDLAAVVSATSRKLAQELLVRRCFLLTPVAENRFQLLESEAFGILIILWCDPLIQYRPAAHTLFQQLHQLLTSS